MGTALQERLKQYKFNSVFQEALLNVLVLADFFTKETETICSEFGITGTQYNVLRILRGKYPEGHARGDIIERMLHQAPDVTRIIDRLVKAGLAERSKSSVDARQSLTFITEKGLQLLQAMDPVVDKGNIEMSKRISEVDAQTLSALCERLYSPVE